MAPGTVPVTVFYSKRGTRPPVYVAGSFSEPKWQPLEMEYATDAQNECRFYKVINVQESATIQYKFRIGEGDWWVLNEDCPLGTDQAGNQNNILVAPQMEEMPDEALETLSDVVGENVEIGTEATLPAAGITNQVSQSVTSDFAAKEEFDRNLSSTPVRDVANTAAEVADTAALLDKNTMTMDFSSLKRFGFLNEYDDGMITPDDQKAPLFSHEILTKSSDHPLAYSSRYSPPIEDSDLYDEIDISNPNLEKFPIDRQGILALIRETSSRLPEDETRLDEEELSRNPNMQRPGLSKSSSALKMESQLSPLENIAEEEDEPNEKPTSPAPQVSPETGKEIVAVGTYESKIGNETLKIDSHDTLDSKSDAFAGIRPSLEVTANSSSDTANRLHTGLANKYKEAAAGKNVMVEDDKTFSTSFDKDLPNNDGKLKLRSTPNTNRPLSAASRHSSVTKKEARSFLDYIWRTIFVQWIGGFIARLCGRNRT